MIIKEIRDSHLNRYIILDEVNLTNNKTQKTFKCLRGFVTDYASTNILKFDEVGQPAALMHDVAYWFQPKSRMQSDIDFKDNLIFLGVSKFKAYAYFLSVRLIGWKAWRENKIQRDLFKDAGKILTDCDIYKLENAG